MKKKIRKSLEMSYFNILYYYIVTTYIIVIVIVIVYCDSFVAPERIPYICYIHIFLVKYKLFIAFIAWNFVYQSYNFIVS